MAALAAWVLALGAQARSAVPDVRRALEDLPVGERVEARGGEPLGGAGAPVRFRFADGLTGDPAVDSARESAMGRLVAAVVAAEDARFFSHRGLDPLAMLRAGWENLKAMRVVQGASTITQQVARTAFGDEIGRRRTLTRKVKESFTALRLRRALTPEEELEAWLTWVPLAPGAPGAIPASRRLFGRAPWDLGLPEAALLAGLAQGPSRYDPLADPDAAKGRRDVVLGRMRSLGLISESEWRAAVASPLGLTPPGSPGRAPGFVREALGHAPPGRGALVTTLDPTMQQAALAAVCYAAWEANRLQESLGPLEGAALVAIEPGTGAVRAYVPHPHMSGLEYPAAGAGAGGALACLDEGLAPRPGDLFDFARAGRQTGSAAKPLVLATALEDGVLEPDEPVWDGPASFWTGDGWWTPRNHDDSYAGLVGWVEALAKSSNPAAAALADRVGMARVAEVARALGVESPLRPTLASALGASEANLLEMVSAYAAIAADGVSVPPRWVEGRRAPDGFDPVPPAGGERALTPYAARALVSLLGEALPVGTAAASVSCDPALPASAGACLLDWMPEMGEGHAAGAPVRAFGKSGTSQDGRDAWFIGCTPALCAGVWLGTPQGGDLAGGHLPALSWNLFMRRVAHKLAWIHFPAPPPALAAGVRGVAERAGYDPAP